MSSQTQLEESTAAHCGGEVTAWLPGLPARREEEEEKHSSSHLCTDPGTGLAIFGKAKRPPSK